MERKDMLAIMDLEGATAGTPFTRDDELQDLFHFWLSHGKPKNCNIFFSLTPEQERFIEIRTKRTWDDPDLLPEKPALRLVEDEDDEKTDEYPVGGI